ncbi:MAG: hypothetical protein JWP06_770 [Candidatus Saccharibacteria bacterium]|nr:hypothetical protein [Candidatus Saccharibacteria bacterium]
MGIFGNKRQGDTGFTIIELIIVIVVISILAAITLVAYPNYQKQTRDNERKSDLNQLATALHTYAFQKNTFVGLASGCGRNGDGNGWVNAGASQPGAGTYPRAISDCLLDIKAISNTSAFIDPSGCIYNSGSTCGTSGATPTTAYMKATCTKSSVPTTYLFARLETQPRQDSVIDGLCDGGSVSGYDATTQLWGTNYGMNYYVVVK